MPELGRYSRDVPRRRASVSGGKPRLARDSPNACGGRSLMPLTYGQLRLLLAEQQLGWMTRTDAAADEPLPQPALGADPEGLVPTDAVEPVAFERLGVSPNPFLALRRLERGIVTPDDVRRVHPMATLQRLGLDDALRIAQQPES